MNHDYSTQPPWVRDWRVYYRDSPRPGGQAALRACGSPDPRRASALERLCGAAPARRPAWPPGAESLSPAAPAWDLLVLGTPAGSAVGNAEGQRPAAARPSRVRGDLPTQYPRVCTFTFVGCQWQEQQAGGLNCEDQRGT